MSGKKVLVIGGGFYGLYTSLVLKRKGLEVVIAERDSELMMRASYVNQARVHNGYHYARSAGTARSSAASYRRFITDFKSAIKTDFRSYYAISKINSYTTPRQYEGFLTQLGIDFSIVRNDFWQLLNSSMIDELYEVDEKVFNTTLLRKTIIQRVMDLQIKILVNTEITSINRSLDTLNVHSDNNCVGKFDIVLNCTYSNINRFSLTNKIDLKHRVSEMALIKVPHQLKNISITVMDGPFFSLMPFPAAGDDVFSLSHVSYTHHDTISESADFDVFVQNRVKLPLKYRSNYPYMLRDAERFVPILNKAEYVDSIWEIKTTLSSSDFNDSRPILFKEDSLLKGYYVILGGKIDNVYDLEEFLIDTF